jgi:hypothetical protein
MWTLQVFDVPSNMWVNVTMGQSGSHRVYVTAGTPKNFIGDAAMDVTDIRMESTVKVVGAAIQTARMRTMSQTPTYARIVYQILRQHVFYVKRGVTGPEGKGPAGVWEVPETWTMSPAGSDCVSGAAFTAYVANMARIRGTTAYRSLAAKSKDQPTTAVDYNVDDPNRTRVTMDPVTGGMLIWNLKLLTGTPDPMDPDGLTKLVPNSFAAAVVYTSESGAKYYFPSGVDEAPGNPPRRGVRHR